ncbi:hypothetical protein Scep_000303 [Stephania cephalantha]|uniref:Beta-galactosidase n=1 Tax=Stephania cephalantha TaxID=152367 RepID=A0AAP0Q2B3_9MAGN
MSISPLLLIATILCSWALLAASDDNHGKTKTVATSNDHHGKARTVTYDGRSIMIDGKRDLFFSGSIHYPRIPTENWGKILDKAKHGGLNVIQTYVFWNIHEPVQGQFDFVGNKDIVKFIKLIQEKGMYVTLRLGPFIEAEWNYGGFPFWLREVPDIIFRTNNEPFKKHMQKFVERIVKMMKDEKLFYPQGGPIILAQIENEYNNIQLAFEEKGAQYVQWAGNMAVGLNVGVPWMMCKQKDAPDPVINSCNGRNCGDTFTGPNKPYKPFLWTENWTAQYRVFGDPPSQRAAEDIAFAVARFYSKNGTLVNYYMYHGGTNYGRTASSFVTTRYYDEAPLDEYGFQKEPKWGHLKDLHSALKLCKKALLKGTPSVQMLGKEIEARVYEKPGSNVCAAFLCNNNTKEPATVNFRGKQYYLPQRSISILPDCKTVVYNSQTVVSQHNKRNFVVQEKATKSLKWEMSQDKIPIINDCPLKSPRPLELMSVTKDTSDFLWYTARIELNDEDLPRRSDIHPVIQVANLGHGMHAFVNGKYIGSGHGSNIEKSFTFQKVAPLKSGTNHIQLLGYTVGLPDSGVYLERRLAGVHAVSVQGLNTGTLDITDNGWGHKVGIEGEKLRLYTQGGSHRVDWNTVKGPGGPLTWYKAYFDAPAGNGPLALNLTSMSKGMAWVNGRSLGRYWVSYLTPFGKPSQAEYHIPRPFVKPTENLLVLLEESGGDPNGITIMAVNRDTICSSVSEYHPPHVKSWERQDSHLRIVADDVKTKADLKCPNKKVMTSVDFASWGDPSGSCGNFTVGTCNSPSAKKVVEQHCLGKTQCQIPIERKLFDKDKEPCPDMLKTLAVQVLCTNKD